MTSFDTRANEAAENWQPLISATNQVIDDSAETTLNQSLKNGISDDNKITLNQDSVNCSPRLSNGIKDDENACAFETSKMSKYTIYEDDESDGESHKIHVIYPELLAHKVSIGEGGAKCPSIIPSRAETVSSSLTRRSSADDKVDLPLNLLSPSCLFHAGGGGTGGRRKSTPSMKSFVQSGASYDESLEHILDYDETNVLQSILQLTSGPAEQPQPRSEHDPAAVEDILFLVPNQIATEPEVEEKVEGAHVEDSCAVNGSSPEQQQQQRSEQDHNQPHFDWSVIQQSDIAARKRKFPFLRSLTLATDSSEMERRRKVKQKLPRRSNTLSDAVVTDCLTVETVTVSTEKFTKVYNQDLSAVAADTVTVAADTVADNHTPTRPSSPPPPPAISPPPNNNNSSGSSGHGSPHLHWILRLYSATVHSAVAVSPFRRSLSVEQQHCRCRPPNTLSSSSCYCRRKDNTIPTTAVNSGDSPDRQSVTHDVRTALAADWSSDQLPRQQSQRHANSQSFLSVDSTGANCDLTFISMSNSQQQRDVMPDDISASDTATTPATPATPASTGHDNGGTDSNTPATPAVPATDLVPNTACVQLGAFNCDVTATSGDVKRDVIAIYACADTVRQVVTERSTNELKQDIRHGCWPLQAPCRRHLWLALCSRLPTWSPSDHQLYTDTVQQMEHEYAMACQFRRKLPSFVHAYYRRRYHLLVPGGVLCAERVLAIVEYSHPTITYAPTLYPLVCLMLHYMNEPEVYCCLSALLRSKKLNFLVQTRCEFEIGWQTLVFLAKKHARSAMQHLSRYAAAGSSEDTLDTLLADWLVWLFCFLPFRHLVRIIDCYLLEGDKILYRAALALLLLFDRAAAKSSNSWRTLLASDPLPNVMEHFCRQIPYSPAKLLSTMFHVKGFSRATIAACHETIVTKLRQNDRQFSFPERSGHCEPVDVAGHDTEDTVSSSAGGDTDRQSQSQLVDGSSTIGIKELLRLWDNLPQRYTLYSPTLLYTSDEHGFSLKTFFTRVEHHEPTVLLLRTVCGAVFGAYCTASWSTRNHLQPDGTRYRYFGTGEMFVFTLRPRFCLYPWAMRQRQLAAAAANDQQLQQQLRVQVPSAAEQMFMAADNEMLAIGGGGGHGHAIWLDENLARGKSDAAATFTNPPLVEGGVFTVACMETFGFTI